MDLARTGRFSATLMGRSSCGRVRLGKNLPQVALLWIGRLIGFVLPSPIGREGYPVDRGDGDLLNPYRGPLDERLSALARRFVNGGPFTRGWIRSSLRQSDLPTLIQFAKRCAVFALRSQDAAPVVEGLSALTLLEPDD